MALPVPSSTLKGGNVFETIVSALVIVVAIVFLGFILLRTGTGHLGSYELRVRLADAGGMKTGSEVRLGGTKIGSVSSLWLDPADYSAVLSVRVRDDLALPVDSRAAISASALGDQYLTVTPGHSGKTLLPGEEFGQPKRTRAKGG